MCDCFDLICKCRKFYVPIHISDYDYPRDIIKNVYCPFCNYRGASIKEIKKVVTKDKYFCKVETNADGEFAVDNWVFHSGIIRGDEGIKEEIIHSNNRIRNYFAIEYDKKHPNYKSGKYFMDGSYTFNGNPNDVENLVSDCYKYRCKNIIKKNHLDEFLHKWRKEQYCKVRKKFLWKLGRKQRYNCKFLKK